MPASPAATAIPESARRAVRLPFVVTGLGITQIIGWGTTYYALGALSPDIARSSGWPPSLIFGAFSACLLLSSLIASGSGKLVDRWGGRNAMALGSIICAAGCLTLGLGHAPWVFVAGWLLLAPGMRLATYDAAFATLSQMAGEHTRRSISYLSLFGGLASTVFWPVGHWLAGGAGWQNTFLIYAALHVLVCLPLHWFLLPAGAPRHATAVEDGEETLAGRSRTLAMLAFAGVLAFNGLVFAAISAHVLPLFTALGITPGHAVLLAACIGPAQVASRLLEIVIGHRWSANALGLISFGLLPLAILLAVLGGFSLPALALFVLVYGASNGLVTIAKGSCSLALFGPVNYGRTLGTLTTPSLVLNALAPLAMAWVLQQLGAQAAMWLCLGFGAASLACMAWLALRFRNTA